MNNFFNLSKYNLDQFKKNVDSARDAVKQIVVSHQDSTFSFNEIVAFFENVIEPIEEFTNKLDYLGCYGLNVQELRDESQKYKTQELSFLFNDKNIYNIIKSASVKNDEEAFYKNFILEKFKSNGVFLSKEDKKTYVELNIKQRELENAFLSNISKSRAEWVFSVSKDEYALFEDELKSCFTPNLERSHYTMRFSMNNFRKMKTLCENDQLRKRFFDQSYLIASPKGTYSNEDHVYEIIDICYQKSNLLGYDTPAQQITEKNMAKSPEKIIHFLQNFNDKIKNVLDQEYKELLNFNKNVLHRNSIEYYSTDFVIEKYKHHYFKNLGINYKKDLEKDYLPTPENSLPILFDFFKELYGFKIEILDEPLENDVKFLSLSDHTGKLKAHIILDLYERENKKSGAYASSIIPLRRDIEKGKDCENESYIFKRKKSKVGLFAVTTNFHKGDSLTLDTLKTLLHEFGHCLHYASSDTLYGELSGTMNLSRDAVEIPSMMLEKFYNDEDLLNKLSNNTIPKDVIDYSKKESAFMIGDFYNRILIMPALFDLKLFEDKDYYEHIKETRSIMSSYAEHYNQNTKFKSSPDNNFPLVFTHLFSGNYKAGYYGYFWADVFAIDAFMEVKKDLDKFKSFKDEFLSKGSYGEPLINYEKFNDKEISIEKLFDFYDLNNLTCIKNNRLKKGFR